MIVSDTTIQAEQLGEVFTNKRKASSKACKKLTKNVLKIPGRALEMRTIISNAAVSKNPEAVLSKVPNGKFFSHTSQGFCFGKIL